MVDNDVYSAAAQHLLEADFILIATGAGFSADSGLPVYNDVARHAYYASRNKSYADLADTNLLMEDPELFWKFWGDCRRLYASCTPHSGYALLEQWMTTQLPKMRKAEGLHTGPNPWFVYTSNVDGHFRRFSCLQTHLCEMHGCVEESVCSSSLPYYITRDHGLAYGDETADKDPVAMEPIVHERIPSDALRRWKNLGTDRLRHECRGKIFPKLAADTNCQTAEDATEGDLEVPICPHCKVYPLRPKVVMFGDTCPNVIPHIWLDTDRYQQWEDTIEACMRSQAGKKIVILELGCGTRVPSVRCEVEEVVTSINGPNDSDANTATGTAVLIRINKDEADICDTILETSPKSISIFAPCREALQHIHHYLLTSSVGLEG